MFERLLVAYDGSDHAERALDAAAELAGRNHTEVMVVHVADLGALQNTTYGADSVTFEWETPQQASELVDAAVSRLRARGIEARGEVRGRFDRTAQHIIDAAKSFDAGVVIMGTRGRSRLPGLTLGSVAHKVIQLSERPVLIVR